MLIEVAGALEFLVQQTLSMMNDGATLDEVLHTVRLPESLASHPYLQPTYDEPEFVVRNIWRLYGGWWDGDPSTLKPPRAADVAVELAALAGGAERLAGRALELSSSGEHRLACHLAELAGGAEPRNASVHSARAELYRRRRETETSLMARSVFGEAAARSAEAAEA